MIAALVYDTSFNICSRFCEQPFTLQIINSVYHIFVHAKFIQHLNF